MKSFLASVRATGGLDRVDHAVQLLEDEWRKHGDVPLERLWAEQRRLIESEPGESVALLAELVKTDLRCRFSRGQTPAVVGYLERFPELQSADTRVLSLIYEEFCLAEERGEGVDVEAFCDRYPRWKESLVSQLQYHHLFSQAAGTAPKPAPFPEAGDDFEEFQLVSLLGRGGTSRVFVARDRSLGGKQVVLKVSLDRGREPQAQGALDHPHIVPVNAVVFGDDGMRGLSMPYRQGLPLDEVIRRVNPASKPPRAIALWEALVKPAESTPDPPHKPETPLRLSPRPAGPRGDGWEGFPVRGSYAQGAAWVVKIIAEALHYAHGEQTFHRDVKPANVLLTVQHGPQLLDFNLAESPHSASQAQAAMHGGTLPYMAPEQIEAFLNPDLWGKVGAPADIYSLGLVLRELLTGQAPDLPAETLAPARAMRVLLDRRPLLDVSVRRTNPAIPHALEAIVAKCLSVPVHERYCDAGALAKDLDRFLSRLPLVHAVNPSRPERCGNWGIRNRVWLALVGVVLGFCTVSLFAGMVLERARTRTRPTVEITASDELKAAVAALNGDHPEDSTLLWDHLVDLYPESSIPKVYRGLAYEASNHPFDAERYFKEAISISNARSEIVPWSQQDPKLLDRLKRFGNRRFQHAKMIESDNELAESERRTACAVQYMLADLAWDIAREIQKERPKEEAVSVQSAPPSPAPAPTNEIRLDSEMTAYNLALSEQELGKYESVVNRADQAIKIVADQNVTDFDARLRLKRRLFEWRQLRSRALAKWAEALRSEGSTDALERALNNVVGAEQDLQICIRYADGEGRNSLDLYTLEKIRVAALMTHVEIDLDLRRLKDANTHVNQARKSLKRYDDLAHLVDRTEDIDSKYERLNKIDHRLRQEQARTLGGDPTEPPRVHAGE